MNWTEEWKKKNRRIVKKNSRKNEWWPIYGWMKSIHHHWFKQEKENILKNHKTCYLEWLLNLTWIKALYHWLERSELLSCFHRELPSCNETNVQSHLMFRNKPIKHLLTLLWSICTTQHIFQGKIKVIIWENLFSSSLSLSLVPDTLLW